MADQHQTEPDQGEAAPPGWQVPGPDRKPIRRAIIEIAVPMAIAELVGLLTMLGVFALMGRMGDESLYVRSFYTPVASLFLAVFLAFLVTNQVAAATSRGQNAPGEVLPLAFSFARLWLVLGVVLVVVSFVGSGAIADLFDVPASARGDFIQFVRWMSIAELSQVGLALAASSLRGFGKPKEGSVLLLLASLIQIGGVWVFGLGTGMGPMSVPMFILIASVVAGGLGYVQLRKAGLWTGGALRQFRPQAAFMLLKIGLPIALTQLILFGANSALIAVLTQLGPDTVAGFSTAASLQFLILMPGIVLGTATAIVLNQQRGAGKSEWLSRTLRVGLEVTAVVYVAIAALVWLGNDLLGSVMTNSDAVSSEIALYFAIVGLTYIFNGPVLAALSIMEQIGAGLVAVVLNFLYFAAMVVAGALVLDAYGTSSSFYQTIAWCNVIGVCLVAFAVLAVRKAAMSPPPQHP